MKKVISILLCLVCIFAVVSCNKDQTKSTFKPETLSEKYFYCFGNFLGNNYKGAFPEVDYNALAEGIKSAGDGSFCFTDEEVQQIAQEFESQIAGKEASENLAAAEAFLAENEKKEGIKKTSSGLQYEVLKQGSGKQPTEANSVTVDYELFDVNGNLIQSTILSGSAATFNLANVIPGFKEGLLLMNEGSQYKLYIHPSIGYGENAPGNIGPNQLLIFDVTLHSVN